MSAGTLEYVGRQPNYVGRQPNYLGRASLQCLRGRQNVSSRHLQAPESLSFARVMKDESRFVVH